MNADLFYTLTSRHWVDMFARARREKNTVAEQIRAAMAVGRAEGDALLAAFRQHQAQSNFGAAAGQVSGDAVHGVNSERPAAPLTFPRDCVTAAGECALAGSQSYAQSRDNFAA
jgi:hypothetical protein